MKYVMLAVVATIGAVALFTIAGAFLLAISEELEDIRELLFAYADAIRVERMRKQLVVLPQYEAYLKQEPSPLNSGLRQEDAAVALEPLLAPAELADGTQTPHSGPLNIIKVEVG